MRVSTYIYTGHLVHKTNKTVRTFALSDERYKSSDTLGYHQDEGNDGLGEKKLKTATALWEVTVTVSHGDSG